MTTNWNAQTLMEDGCQLPRAIINGNFNQLDWLRKNTGVIGPATYTQDIQDGIIVCHTDAGDVTVALLNLDGVTGRPIHIVKYNQANTVTIVCNGTDRIKLPDGSTVSTITIGGQCRTVTLRSAYNAAGAWFMQSEFYSPHGTPFEVVKSGADDNVALPCFRITPNVNEFHMLWLEFTVEQRVHQGYPGNTGIAMRVMRFGVCIGWNTGGDLTIGTVRTLWDGGTFKSVDSTDVLAPDITLVGGGAGSNTYVDVSIKPHLSSNTDADLLINGTVRLQKFDDVGNYGLTVEAL